MTIEISTNETLNPEKTLAFLAPEGPLSRILPSFEARQEQIDMMRDVIEAYNTSKVALIEAGTGTGKSIAYLLPAILWAIHTGERTLISTNTINLQEQLLYKDIPLLAKAMGHKINAVLVKGMGNYLCLRKLFDVQQESQLIPGDEEAVELQKIEKWGNTTSEGSRSNLSFMPKQAIWEKVCAESDTCTREKCPFYKKCFFFKARKQANDAQIMISNHSLLFSDLAFRSMSENGAGILPDYKRVVLDEAHNIEDIATDHFASKANGLAILRTLGRLASEKRGKAYGKLQVLYDNLIKTYGHELPDDVSAIINKLNLELSSLRRDIRQQTVDLFDSYANFIDIITPGSEEDDPEGRGVKENKLRILPQHLTHAYWRDELVVQSQELIKLLRKFVQVLHNIESDLQNLFNESFDEKTQGIRAEITALANRLEGVSETLEAFIHKEIPGSKVRWIASQNLPSLRSVNIVDADLDISHLLVDSLFLRFPTTILCSATLTTNRHFKFIRERLGLTTAKMNGKPITENIYESPFDFKNQALLAIPTDMPDPSDSQFTKEAAKRILQAIQASHGNTFVLFTSYSMLRYCSQLLSDKLKELRFPLLKQGDNTRKKLLEEFIKTDRSVLFGTDSFWEGVDVAGDALRCVIITKLPFQVPKEPIIQARMEAIKARGGNPFMDYAVPNAIVKFKQGFGRLIRKKKDRGCIICLDSRLVNKYYGKLFLNSLPECQKIFVTSDEMVDAMKTFYKRTYHLTKS